MMQLGDAVSSALAKVGITEEAVTKFLGRPCGCGERRRKLNLLGQWAARVLAGKTEDAQQQLDEVLKEQQ